jgi:hypothetical protein
MAQEKLDAVRPQIVSQSISALSPDDSGSTVDLDQERQQQTMGKCVRGEQLVVLDWQQLKPGSVVEVKGTPGGDQVGTCMDV